MGCDGWKISELFNHFNFYNKLGYVSTFLLFSMGSRAVGNNYYKLTKQYILSY